MTSPTYPSAPHDSTLAERVTNSNLVKIRSGWNTKLQRYYGESFEEVLQNKGPWLEKYVGEQQIDWKLISTGYLWFKRKEDKVMYILKWEGN